MKNSIAKSREVTAPEIIFDQTIGDLFVIRAAGNLVDDYGLGSIEYAVDHLGTRLIVVLGHERCGAVTAALAGGSAPGHTNYWCAIFNPRLPLQKEKAVTRSLMLSKKMMRRSQRRFESRPNSASSLLKFG